MASIGFPDTTGAPDRASMPLLATSPAELELQLGATHGRVVELKAELDPDGLCNSYSSESRVFL